MNIMLDLKNKRFGKWKVLRRAKNTKRGSAQWWCLCTGCNREIVVTSGNLRAGKSSECQQCAKRLPDGEASFRSLYREYKQGADERDLCFRLSMLVFRRLTSSVCHYCGTEPHQIWGRGETYGHYIYNGVDRKNNKLGYSLANCVACCGVCNKAKLNTSYEDFLSWIQKVYEWRKLGRETC